MPGWLATFGAAAGEVFVCDADRMGLAVELSRRNVAAAAGGPFGAAVFERDTGRLVAVGVNLVVPSHCSCAHAEIVALTLAQQARGHWDLGAVRGLEACELASSCEPCAMCLGAVQWSGVTRLLCGARDEDAREAGFDEGLKPAGWAEAFDRRGIAVVHDLLRDEAAAVLRDYAQGSGEVYNPGGAK